jgi:hypothetical protein
MPRHVGMQALDHAALDTHRALGLIFRELVPRRDPGSEFLVSVRRAPTRTSLPRYGRSTSISGPAGPQSALPGRAKSGHPHQVMLNGIKRREAPASPASYLRT